MTTIPHPRRRVGDSVDTRTSALVSQQGVKLRLQAALFGFLPLIGMHFDTDSLLSRSLAASGGVGLTVSLVMLPLSAWLILDWLCNDERMRKNQEPQMRWLYDHRDMASSGLAISWGVIGMVCLMPQFDSTALAWFTVGMLKMVFGLLEAQEDSWRRGNNGPPE